MGFKAGHTAAIAAGAAIAVCFAYGCSITNNGDSSAMNITILTQSAVGNSVTPDSIVKKKAEELTNTKLDIEFVPGEAYADVLNRRMASGSLPMITYINENTPNVISAVRDGDFWDITDRIGNYGHLSKIGEAFLRDISIDGRVYGLCRRRDVGRFGYVYRKDWLDRLGLEEPHTVDEFCNMLRAFTYDDPDGNGKDDTYGMTVTVSDISFYNFAVWMGAPNGWGFNEEGILVPDNVTSEYFETVKLFRQFADEGLINPDFMVMDSADWNEPFIAGESGVILDTCDRAGALNAPLTENFPEARLGIAGVINGRARPHLGYSGYFAFPKSSVKDEETLNRLLEFMDRCCDDDVFTLMRFGIEGRHYDMVNGYIRQRTGPEVPREEINDFNQVLTYADSESSSKLEQTELQKTIAEIQKSNERYIVGNPAEGLISDTYIQNGLELDKIVSDARIKYISGQLDDAGYEAQMQLWYEKGGAAVIEEINEAYKIRKQ